MTTANKTQKTIAIIGGGVSGALVAYHLIRQRVQARVVLIDPSPHFGLGLAYSTPSLRHLLNVPAGKISALPEEPDHFLHWLRIHHDLDATPMTFAPRAIFGRYVQSLLSKTTAVEQILATVTNYRRMNSGAMLTLSDDSELHAVQVVLATGNFDPATLPGISEAAQISGAYCHNAWIPDTYANLAPEAPVMLIGTGLTGVDVLLRLRELGHRGPITAVSRHGIFPHRHAASKPLSTSAIPADTPATCLAYFQSLRAAMRHGVEWRAAIDSLRATTNDLWLALPLSEQKRFRRHLQRRWDVVRHRMAPPIADIIEAELQARTLTICEGHLVGIEANSTGATAIIRTASETKHLISARVINCTGPNMNYRRVTSPLLNSLFEQGIVFSGPLGLGFHCTPTGAMIDASGQVSETLFNLGPGRLGTLLESIAVPEIRQQAIELATMLTEHLNIKEPTAHEIESPVYAPQNPLQHHGVTAA